MPRPNIWGVLIILLAILLLFGWKRLPDLARSIGQSLRIFKSEVEQMTDKDGSKGSKPSAASQDTIRSRADEPDTEESNPVQRPEERPGTAPDQDPARADEHRRP